MLGFLFTSASYLLGALAFYFFSRGRGLSLRQSGWLLAAALCGGIIGAKLTRLVFAAASGVSLESLFVHPDGRTIIGGVIFGWLSVEICKKKLGIKRSTGDAFALALSLGEAFGRIGCYFNSCCYGAAAAGLPWAVYQASAWRHPVQIYSAIVALSCFLVLLFMKNRVKFEGDLFRLYIVIWGSSRFVLEFMRERTELFYGLSLAQWTCLELVVFMILGTVMRNRKLKPLNSEPDIRESGAEA